MYHLVRANVHRIARSAVEAHIAHGSRQVGRLTKGIAPFPHAQFLFHHVAKKLVQTRMQNHPDFHNVPAPLGNEEVAGLVNSALVERGRLGSFDGVLDAEPSLKGKVARDLAKVHGNVPFFKPFMFVLILVPIVNGPWVFWIAVEIPVEKHWRTVMATTLDLYSYV